MFIKIDNGLYINTDNIITIEIIDISELDTEEESSLGFKIVFISNTPDELIVMKHEHAEHERKDCGIEYEIGNSPKVYIHPDLFPTKEDAANWVETNISNMCVVDRNKLN